MNLHAVVAGAVGIVNPFIPATLRISTGSVTNDDGSRTPDYSDLAVLAQVQALTADDIRHLDSLNIQGVMRAIYLYGRSDGLVRPQAKGGDLVVIATGGNSDGTWLVTQNLEQWPEWCKTVCTLQNA